MKEAGKGPAREKGDVKTRAGAWLLAALLLVWLICLAVAVTVWFRPLYYWDMDHLDIPARAGLPSEVVRANYDVLIDYNLMISPDTLTFPDLVMSETGRIHFEEVKRIFVAAQWIAVLGTPVLAAAVIGSRRAGRAGSGAGGRTSSQTFHWIFSRALAYAGYLALGAVVLVGGLVAVSWDTAFVLMHKVLFRNDFWIFNAKTDPVITILPDTFFLHCGVMILLLVAAGVVLFRLLCFWLNRGSMEKRTEVRHG